MTAATENDAPNIEKTEEDKTETKTEPTEMKTEDGNTKTEEIKTEVLDTETPVIKPEVVDAKTQVMKSEVTDAETQVIKPEVIDAKTQVIKPEVADAKTQVKMEVIDTTNVKVEPDVAAKIMKQLEYYFGDKNLPQDRFMLREVTLDQGWIPLQTMLNFKRLANICSDKATIARTVEQSNSELVMVNTENTKIRRNPDKPLPRESEEGKAAANAKTVYVKGLPSDLNMDRAEQFFAPHGRTCYIKLRKNQDSKFKGSIFVEFMNQSDADKFLETKDIKLDDAPLVIMGRNEYFRAKNQNIKNERTIKREEQLSDTKPIVIDKVEYEKGRVLKITGLEDVTTTREEMKTLFEGQELSWITYNKGDKEAFIRFDKSAQEAVDKVKVDGKFVLSDKELSPVVLVEDEEESYWKQAAMDKAEFFRRSRKRRAENNRGGRGGRGNKRHRY